MFVPKFVLFILFFVAIASTGGVLYLLSQRIDLPARGPSASTTVFVSASVAPAPSQSPVASQSSVLSASAEWKTATSSALSIKLDYPSHWSTSATDAAELKVFTPVSPDSALITLSREKKEKSSDKIAAFVKVREESYKKETFVLKDDKAGSVDDYISSDRTYTQQDTQVREIVFATKNYFYIITIRPQADTAPVIEELLKSIDII